MKKLSFDQCISFKSYILPCLTSVKSFTGTTHITVTFLVKMHKFFSGILLQIKAVRIWVVQRSIAIFITDCLKVFPVVLKIFFPSLHCIKILKFHLILWCVNFVERHSFHIVSDELSKTLRKLCFSTKFPHQEIR